MVSKNVHTYVTSKIPPITNGKVTSIACTNAKLGLNIKCKRSSSDTLSSMRQNSLYLTYKHMYKLVYTSICTYMYVHIYDMCIYMCFCVYKNETKKVRMLIYICIDRHINVIT